jgi:gliding motility-associated-like protein
LRYAFVAAFLGATKGGVPIDASSPPYIELDYRFGYSPQQPLGDKVNINPITGMISGTAPPEGTYVITVAVTERRNGQVINIHRKDLHLKVAECTIASATLRPAYITCKDNGEILLNNETPSPKILSYEWDADTASLADPLITTSAALIRYANPGTYTLRLITNKGQECADTAYTNIRVFPGFNPAFDVEAGCNGLPYRFQDQTATRFGTVNQWQWDFGDPASVEDIATSPSASYRYGNNGKFRVSLIVSTDIGCRDTLFRDVEVGDRPDIGLMDDTLICTIDTIRLQTKANGTFNWTPNYMISDLNAAAPLVSPDVPTTYYLTFYSSPGCFNTDSVFVDVRSFVSLRAGQDTTVCLGDSIFLRPQSDGLSYRWSPAATVSSPTAKETWARPTGTTRYSVVSTIGKCQATDGFVVNTVSYPVADAGADTVICIGDAAFLSARGGQQYFWYPGNTLDDQTLRSPEARPLETTDYAVAVYDDRGCPKPSYDTVRVVVIPPVDAFAGNDTVMVIGQPMQLRASGGSVYSWSPVANLDRPDAEDPIARLNDDMTFVVRVSTQEGCYAFDTVQVKVYKTPPELFVPTAFTPNGDGLNDRLKPVPVGIATLVYFKVYNRYGELVFSTNEVGKGWNGMYKGRDQGNESFVWQALGIDYLGNQVFRKGQTTLIR